MPADASSAHQQEAAGAPHKEAEAEAEGGVVFVTVGTTQFDALVREVDSAPCKAQLLRRGYSRLRIQKGKGAFTPKQEQAGPVPGSALGVEAFDFAASLAEHVQAAALVISHAGSGSIFEALRAKKPLVVVINEALMDNHQQELANALAEKKYLFCATPDTLCRVLREMDLTSLQEYPHHEAGEYAQHFDKFLGFS